MYKLETVLFQNGERFPLLVNKETGIADFYSTLWVTVELRYHCAVNTIRNKLGVIQWLMDWEQNNKLIISEMLQKEIVPTEGELETLIRHMKLNAVKQKKTNCTKRKIIKKVQTQFIKIFPSVSLNHQYNRLTVLSEYILFLSKVIRVSSEYQEKLANLLLLIKASKPKNHKNFTVRVNEDLSNGLLDEFMSIANYSNPNNPFQNIGIKKRNYLMFILLKELGIRRGELLSIQIPFIEIGTTKPSILIRRTHDDKFDSRKTQAVSKTKERRLPISQKIAQLIDDYIMNYRSKIPNANKHPYLFVTHRKGKTQGNPISTSSFDNVIVPTMKKVDPKFSVIHPHIFRHEWNLDFSKKIDKNNQSVSNDSYHKDFISPEKEAKMRQHLMGHVSEKSGDVYNQRYIREKANKILLELQTEFQKKLTIMSQKKILRQSRDGYAFYENENSWRISKDIKINFSQAVLNIDKKTLNSFRKTLAIYAEKYSSYHTINMYNRFHELVVNTQLKTIDTYTLLNWKTNLGKEREWHLGSLKGFLLSWYEYGYYGVDKAVASLLESFTLSGNDKGKSVIMRCPYTGAFTENEILALMTELARLWKEDLISFETYTYIHLLQATARRPIQIRHLKFEDLKKEASQGTWNYFLNIPSAKKRGGLFRKTFKKIAITEDLYLVLLNFLEYQYKKLLSLVDEAFISDYKMKLPMFIDWRFLKNNIKNRNFDLSLLELDIFHYSSSSLELNVLRKFCIHQKAVLERTGEIIHVNARRFRHTRGTNLGRKGVGAAIIAELLDHSDTQNVKVYTENTADTVQYIDRVMGAEMGKLAQAFVGRIISNLNESERGFDPTSLITNNGVDTIGACGTNDFCITGYETCYLCPKFRPLVDGPHQQILNKLYKEKEERLRRTKSIDYASSKDRIILAVEYVVQACNEMKKNMEAH